MGYVYLEQGDREKAARHLGKALKLVPYHPWAHCGMAKLAVERKDRPAAYAHATAALVAAHWATVQRKHDDFRAFFRYGQDSPGHFIIDILEVLADLHNHGWDIEGFEELIKGKKVSGYETFLKVRDVLLKQKVKPY